MSFIDQLKSTEKKVKEDRLYQQLLRLEEWMKKHHGKVKYKLNHYLKNPKELKNIILRKTKEEYNCF